MEDIRILLVENEDEDIKTFANCLKATSGVELIGIARGSTEAFDMTIRLRPNAVILDLELGEGNGLEYLYRLKAIPAQETPFVVVITGLTNPITLQEVRANGAGFIFVKTITNFHPSQVTDFLRRTSKFFMGQQPYGAYRRSMTGAEGAVDPDVIQRMFETDLENLHIKLSSKGGRYLLQCILLIHQQPELIDSLISVVYPLVAEQNGTEWKNVERNVRSCIESAWNSADSADLRQYYTGPITSKQGKPTSKEFISYCARRHLSGGKQHGGN